MRAMIVSVGLVLLSSPIFSQEHQHSPYAHQGSDIASLSPKELADLEAGAGMGLARAAELNSFPGPRHVLELADSLGLSHEQRAQILAIRAAMGERAIALGREIIEAERALSQRFADGQVDSATVRTATQEIAGLAGELRFVHLAAHLATRSVLGQGQVETYDRLRGYTKSEE